MILLKDLDLDTSLKNSSIDERINSKNSNFMDISAITNEIKSSVYLLEDSFTYDGKNSIKDRVSLNSVQLNIILEQIFRNKRICKLAPLLNLPPRKGRKIILNRDGSYNKGRVKLDVMDIILRVKLRSFSEEALNLVTTNTIDNVKRELFLAKTDESKYNFDELSTMIFLMEIGFDFKSKNSDSIQLNDNVNLTRDVKKLKLERFVDAYAVMTGLELIYTLRYKMNGDDVITVVDDITVYDDEEVAA